MQRGVACEHELLAAGQWHRRLQTLDVNTCTERWHDCGDHGRAATTLGSFDCRVRNGLGEKRGEELSELAEQQRLDGHTEP